MQKDLFSFLRLGYYLDFPISFEVAPRVIDGIERSDCIQEEALNLLRGEVSRFVDKNKNKKIVVPLSGGYDSRLLLALVLECVEANNIFTYTFGTPNTYDYDIASLLASSIGTNHISIDLSVSRFTEDDIIYNNSKVKGQCLLFYSTPFSVLDGIYGKDAVYFSGFMGDPIAGSKLSKYSSDKYTKSEWINSFLNVNSVTSFKFDLPVDNIVAVNNNVLSFYENIDFHNRQAKYIQPHVFPDESYFSPFLAKDFIDLMFSLSAEERYNCAFYYNFCHEGFPELFGKPMKQFSGLSHDSSKLNVFFSRVKNICLSKASNLYSFRYIDKRTNYFDLNYRLDYDAEFNKVFSFFYYEGFKELTKLGVFSYRDKPLKSIDKLVIASLGAQYLSGKRW